MVNIYELFIVILIDTAITYLILRSSLIIKQSLGDTGIKLVTRFIGLIMLSSGLQIIIKNLIKVIKINFAI